jgi:hypothetical protein
VVAGGEGSKQSRLEQDFTIISWIGRGGFGDVIQVPAVFPSKYFHALTSFRKIP